MTGRAEAHVKLPEDVTPTHYALTIRTDLEKEEYDGWIEIDLDVNVPTKSITFHIAEPTTITHAVLLEEFPTDVEIVSMALDISVDKELGRATVTFDESLHVGTKAKLGLTFKSLLTDSLLGYYKSTYKHEGRKGIYALTQFEAAEARRAFPCWDEPAIKATFAISLLSRSETVSLSNMDIASSGPSDGASSKVFLNFTLEEKPGDWTLTKFSTTPKMSTYLVAWANGPFEHIESSYTSTITGNKVALRVYATAEHIAQAGLTLDVTARVMPIYEQMFDIPYPLPKLDTLVADDFDLAAMENWGLITGRTSVYLYDAHKSGLRVKQSLTKTHVHEVAHQWFGNIVTMHWWDNLWLNEAFATLMGDLIIIRLIHPEWDPDALFVTGPLSDALDLDSLRSSHPIEVACPDEKAINQIFDAISYSKGAAVLRMLSAMIGEDVFLKGVSIYLKKHLYGNTSTGDLWRGISEAGGVDVGEIMSSWILKPGYPVLQAVEMETGLHIKQSRFLATNDVKPEEDETVWHIPLNIQTVGASGKALVDNGAVLKEKAATFAISNVADSLYKLNAGTTGVYRVLYSPEHLSKLGDEAARANSSLSREDRIGLVSDAFVLARAGYGSTSAALNLINKLCNDEDYLVWSGIGSAVSDLFDVWWDEPETVRNGLKAFRRSLFAPLVEKLGFDGAPDDAPDVVRWRSIAITHSAMADDPKTIVEIQQRFSLLVESNDASRIPGDLQDTIFLNAVRTGGEREWEHALDVYRNPKTPSQKTAAITALCRAQNSVLIKKTFDLILSEEVKLQDYIYFFMGCALNPYSRRDLWMYLQAHLDTISKKLEGGFMLGNLVQISFDYLSSVEDVGAVEEFFRDKDTSNYGQLLAQSLDTVRSKAAWLERSRDEVREWLTTNEYM
ncbi:hypothetical protein CALVIDRAFT_526105 [Calocera viscosa TUFC12733]|uniref:Aminopeptidase n=1 Tax=Calocera viscosa (strain TUFC12733) TaxID=1330018 RepID=A0A167NXZ5_CALVF|nr:hypothetical protein CALVIDRAFT_526105 [Calocera viscosa TUFC12733]